MIKACKISLDLLGLDYLDLWLMHYPCANNPDLPKGTFDVIDVPFTETWKAMEQCVEMGLARNIGVSSRSIFNESPRLTGTSDFSEIELKALLADCRIRPALHQLERHPYLPQNAFMRFHKEVRIRFKDGI